MIVYVDTSALIKKYINEKGSKKIEELFNKVKIVYVSAITEIEAVSAFKRLLKEKAINNSDYEILKKELEIDLNYFEIIDFNSEVIEEAKKMIEKYQIKALDSIQLASLKLVKDEINYFVVCDSNLIKNADYEKIKIINPND